MLKNFMNKIIKKMSPSLKNKEIIPIIEEDNSDTTEKVNASFQYIGIDYYHGQQKIKEFDPATLDYQKLVLNILFTALNIESTDLKDKKILEIGGHPYGISHTLSRLSGKKVTIVNPWPPMDNLDNQLVNYKQCLLEDLQDSEDFDLIIGMALTEHLMNPDQVFQKCFALLKDGGLVGLQGGPHFLSDVGHHLYLQVDGKQYDFFNNNPIDDFSHLYLSRWQMAECLKEKNIHVNVINRIIDHIYVKNNEINKLPAEEIINLFTALPWQWADADFEIHEPSAEVKRKIYIKHPEYKDKKFIYSLYLCAKK